MSGNFLTEIKLVESLKQRDTNSLDYLYDKYAAALFGVIIRIVGEEEIAEDALQDCFLKIWYKIESYDRKRGRFFTWMINIARNTAIDFTRSKKYKKKPENQSIDNFTLNNPNLSLNTNIDHIGLREIVDRLAPDLKLVIDILYFKGYTHSEAAKELEMPLGTVKTRARKAILELRKML